MGPKIAIIGGGIGGLTAAVALARKGLAAEVYEQAPVLEEVGAGVGLWPNAMAALESIGLSSKVARLAVNVARQGLRRSDGTWLVCFPWDWEQPTAWFRSLERQDSPSARRAGIGRPGLFRYSDPPRSTAQRQRRRLTR